MFLLWHPSLTAINLSYTFPILETSATALCGTTGNLIGFGLNPRPPHFAFPLNILWFFHWFLPVAFTQNVTQSTSMARLLDGDPSIICHRMFLKIRTWEWQSWNVLREMRPSEVQLFFRSGCGVSMNQIGETWGCEHQNRWYHDEGHIDFWMPNGWYVQLSNVVLYYQYIIQIHDRQL